MKILHVAPCYHPASRYGGPIFSIHQFCQQLVKEGVDVSVFTTNADGDAILDVPVGKEVLTDGVRVSYFPVEFPRSFYRSLALAAQLRAKVGQFDLVHISWLYVYTTLAAARACRVQNIPYILSPRGMLDERAIGFSGKWKKKLYLNLIEKRHINRARTILFSSVGERENSLYRQWYQDDVVIPNGVDLEDFSEVPDQTRLFDLFPELMDRKVVLSLGRLHEIKGLDLLLDAWTIVISEVPDAHLVVAGTGAASFEQKLLTRCRNLNIENTVTFTGFIAGEQKLSILNLAELLVSTSHFESFGMAIVEAMACSKPVVVTDQVRISPEIAATNSGLVTTGDAGSIAAAIVGILDDPELKTELGTNARHLVSTEFSIQTAAAKLLSAYEDILSLHT